MEKTNVRKFNPDKFDPNGPGIQGQLFGLPFTPETAELIVVPVPWEVTVSYHGGASLGPAAILDASTQVDLFMKDIPEAWKLGISMLPIPQGMEQESARLRELAGQYLSRLDANGVVAAEEPLLQKINESCENLNIYIKNIVTKLMRDGKMVALLGGDHSIPLGYLRALPNFYARFGILQIDAHADLRKAYQGFAYSHASIMHNALKIPAVNRLIQVGIRDLCEEESEMIHRARGRIVTFFDEDIKGAMYAGKTWDNICDKIIEVLPENIYISFDIDGLDPKLCPNTGTPVAGGLEFFQVVHLLKRIVVAGKRIIGFDLNEVAPARDNDWDANVGARLLYQLASWTAVTRGRLKSTI
jgi:agmatinase